MFVSLSDKLSLIHPPNGRGHMIFMPQTLKYLFIVRHSEMLPWQP